MLTKQQRQIVEKARDRIADPAHWCRKAFARTASGHICDVTDPRARRFCAVGALAVEYLAAGSEWPDDDGDKLAARFDPRGRTLVDVNDDDGQSAVLALLDKALAEA